MKRIFLLFLVLTTTVLSQAQVSKKVQITAGGLSAALTQTERETITELTIEGTIDAREFRFMRDSMPVLEVIDIVNTTIKAYSGNKGPLNYNASFPADEVPENAFYRSMMASNPEILLTIKLPKTATSIGEWAFCNRKKLKTVQLPSKLVIINELAFMECNSIENIVLPQTLTEIGELAFNKTGLKSLVIPKNVKKLGESVFSSCSYITTVEIQAQLTSIPASAFELCTRLTSVILPNTVKTIEKNAFRGCMGLKRAYLPNTVTKVEADAFNFCNDLEYIYAPSSITTYGYQAFYNMVYVKSVIIENPIPVDISTSYAFQMHGTFSACTLYVHQNSINAYKAAEGWKNFKFIEPLKTMELKYGFNKLPGEAGTQTIDITCSGNWKIDTGSAWLTVSPESGTGNAKVTVSYTGNPNTSDRTAPLAVWASNAVPQLINVTQSGVAKTLEAATNTATLTAEQGAKQTVEVTANVEWTATSNQTWLTVQPSGNNTGNASLILSASSNPTTTNREAVVTIAATGMNPISIAVTQQGAAPSLNVSKTTIDLQRTAGSKATFSVTSNTAWTLASDSEWLTASKTEGTQDANIVLTASANTSIETRQALVTLSANGVDPKIITITQEAALPNLAVSKTTIELEQTEGSKASVEITSNTTWSLTSDAEWLTASKTSGTLNDSIVFTVSANTSILPRQALVTLTANGVDPVVVTIAQEGALPSLTVAQTALTVGKEGITNWAVSVTSNTEWTAVSDQTWVSLSTSSNSDSLILTVAANPEKAERQAQVTLSATGVEAVVLVVTQAANDGVGVETLSAQKLSIVPTLVEDCFQIEGLESRATITIVNLSGKVVQTTNVERGSISISIGQLASGTYLVQIETDNATQVLRVVKK